MERTLNIRQLQQSLWGIVEGAQVVTALRGLMFGVAFFAGSIVAYISASHSYSVNQETHKILKKQIVAEQSATLNSLAELEELRSPKMLRVWAKEYGMVPHSTNNVWRLK